VLVLVVESKHISLYEHEDDDEDDLSNRDDDPLPDFFSGIKRYNKSLRRERLGCGLAVEELN
jgi:hypothetical protein